jgi:hypothetical protein
MVSSLKAATLVAAALCTIGAVGASGAQGAPEFHAEQVPAFIHGESSNHEFKVDTGVAKCTAFSEYATVTGTVTSNTTTTATVTPSYAACHCYGVKCSVDVNGCTYIIHLTSGGASPYGTTVDVACPAGKVIELTAVGIACTVTIGPQSGLEGMQLTNQGGPGTTRDVLATIEVGGIAYAEHGLECAGDTGPTTNGTYKGTVTVKGFQDNSGVQGAQQGIWVQ